MDDITTKHHPEDPEENPRVAFEHGDADVFSVSKYGIGLAFGVVIAAAAMYFLFDHFMGTRNPQPVLEQPRVFFEERQNQIPPAPRLQRLPKVDMREYRAAEEEWLSNYGWADKNKGLARIPIEDAINMVAAKGLASRPGIQASNGLDAEGFRLMPEDSSSGRTDEKVSQ